MDVISSVSAIVGLVFNFATAIKTCNDIRGRYKDADRTIQSLRHELETLQGALQELANLMMHDASALTSRWDTNKTLPRTFERAVRGFKRTLKSLQDDMDQLGDSGRLSKMEKVKLLWNDDAMKEHLGQLRAQSSALQLLLLVLQTGSISDVKSNLNNVEAALLQLSISSDLNGSGDQDRPPSYHNDEARSSHFNDPEKGPSGPNLSIATPDRATPSPHQPPVIVDTTKISNGVSGEVTTYECDSDVPATVAQAPREGLSTRAELHTISYDMGLTGDINSAMPGTFEIDGNPKTPVPTSLDTRENSGSEAVLERKDALDQERVPDPKEAQTTEAAPSKDMEQESKDAADNRQLPKAGKVTGHSVSAKYDPRSTPPTLIRAVYRGDVAEVRSLIAAGTDIEVRHPHNKRTAAIIAAQLGDSEILEILLDSGADIAAKDRWIRRTALRYAASEGWIDCVKLLFSRGAPVDCTDYQGAVPLLSAFRYFGNDPVLELMLANHPDPLQYRDLWGRSILHWAVSWQETDVRLVQLILDKIRTTKHQHDCPKAANDQQFEPLSDCGCHFYPGIDVEDIMGDTALRTAIRYGMTRIVSILLECSPRSAVDSPQRKYNWTSQDLTSPNPIPWERPLHSAVRNSQLDLLKVLIVAGANLELLDSGGQTALQFAVHKKNKDATMTLLGAGATFTTVCTKHKELTLLEEAVKGFSPAILDDLVASLPGLDICSSADARAVLKQAQIGSTWEAIRKLVGQCADQEQVGKIMDEEETLLIALSCSSPDFVDFLIRSGADVNIQLINFHKIRLLVGAWRLPIHVVAGYGDTDMASVLLKNGASIWSKASNSWLPLHQAVRFSNVATVRYFLGRMTQQTSGDPVAIQPPELKRALKIACKRGSVDIVGQLVAEMTNMATHQLQNEALYTAVQYGRREVTDYLLNSCPFSITALGAALKTAKFESLEDQECRPGNTPEDYEACRVRVESAKGPSNKTKRRT